MSGNIVLGIDLGTTNSVVAVADGDRAQVLADLDGQKLIPSVVSFLPDGKVITGDLARERRLVDAKNTVYAIKRLIGRPFDSPEVQRAQERFAFELVSADNGGVRVDIRGEQWTLAEISAYVLRECRRVAEQVLEQDCSRAVITVPANFNELQRSATKAAGKVAGLEVLRILNEPTAAAVAYGYGAEEAETVAVYDFGGGTFDITILELDDDVFEVVSTAGDTFLGGDDIDLLVAEDMADAFFKIHKFDPRADPQVFERLRASAEWAKCVLSGKSLVKVNLPDLAKGRGGKDLGLEFHTTRMKLEDRIRPLLDRSLGVCSDALKQASLEPKDIDRVVMVGGSTRIPMVHAMVTEFFGQEGHREMDPDLVVALGAAIQAFALAEGVPRKTLSMIKAPSAAAVEEVKKKKETARMERPAQPAFAVPAPVQPMPVVVVGSSGTPADAAPAAGRYVPPRPKSPGRSEPTPAPEQGGGDEALDELEDFDIAFDDTPDLTDELEELVSAPPVPKAPLPGLPAVLLTLDEAEEEKPGGDYAFAGLDIDLPPAGHAASADIDPPPAAPAPIPAQRQAMDMEEDRVVPTLMDVTPHSLGIATAGGWCEHVIRRNSPIPVEQIRLFTTAQDGQDTVHVLVCQGESRAYEENQPLGEIVLTGLRQARRGEVHIEVTFMLDANGTLDVEAKDKDTGQVQTIRIKLVGGFSDDEVQAMRHRQEARVG